MSYTFTKWWCLSAHNASLTYLGRAAVARGLSLKLKKELQKTSLASTPAQVWVQHSCTFAWEAHLLKNKEPSARKRELGEWGRAELLRCEWRLLQLNEVYYRSEERQSPAGSCRRHQARAPVQECNVQKPGVRQRGKSPAKGKNLPQTTLVSFPGCLITLCQRWWAAQHNVGLWAGCSSLPSAWQSSGVRGPCPVALWLSHLAGGWISTWLHCQGALGRAEGTEGLLSTKDSSLEPFLLWLLHAGSYSRPFSRGLMHFLALVTMAELARHCGWALQHWGRSNLMQWVVTAWTCEFNGTKKLKSFL